MEKRRVIAVVGFLLLISLSTGSSCSEAKKAKTTIKSEEACGCVRDADYWKTHAEVWSPSQSYTNFFDSGLTWMDVLNAQRRGGDVFFPLAQAYIVTTLNKTSNSCFPCDELCTLSGVAEYYFANPNTSLAANGWQYYMGAAETFNTYNNGAWPAISSCE